MLKAEIDGEGKPEPGTPQGGILSPLLANVVLNELDWWLSNQWITYHAKNKEFKQYVRKNGTICSYERAWLRKNTKLKEFYFVRYADDFKIICKNYQDAVKLKTATTKWLKERLKLEVSDEKTKIVNLKKNYSDFLGFKIKVRRKNKKNKDKLTIISHVSNKAKEKVVDKLKKACKEVKKSNTKQDMIKSINDYNAKVIGIHSYYNKATSISIDMNNIRRRLSKTIRRTFSKPIDFQLPNNLNNGFIEKTYGKSKRIIKYNGMYVVPISYVKYKKPVQQSNDICKYTEEGRIKIHTELVCMNYETINDIVQNPFDEETVELNDVIIPKCAGQYGKCYISAITITKDNLSYMLKNPNKAYGKYDYQNIIILDKNIKGLLLRKGCGIMEFKKKYFKERRKIGTC